MDPTGGDRFDALLRKLVAKDIRFRRLNGRPEEQTRATAFASWPLGSKDSWRDAFASSKPCARRHRMSGRRQRWRSDAARSKRELAPLAI